MVIFFKKDNRKYIKNYRPICMLSNMNILFTPIITTRLEKKLRQNQPIEQAEFRSKYSTTYHIHAINQLKEKFREYNIPIQHTTIHFALRSWITRRHLTKYKLKHS